jgi:hypothetical protein
MHRADRGAGYLEESRRSAGNRRPSLERQHKLSKDIARPLGRRKAQSISPRMLQLCHQSTIGVLPEAVDGVIDKWLINSPFVCEVGCSGLTCCICEVGQGMGTAYCGLLRK